MDWTRKVNPVRSTWSAAQGLSSIVGDATGYNGVMEGGFGVDRQSQTMLSMSDRWSQGFMGGSQMILTGVGLKAAYNPNATFWTGNEGVMSGQVASSYPQNRRVGGRGEGVRAIDPPAGFQEACAWDLTPDNLRLMEAGRPPIGRDGLPVELHHRNQNPLGPLDEMTSTTHDTIDHPISPSQINRSLFAGERARFWRQRARQLLGQQ